MKTTLKTSEDENYTQNEWRWKLHSERVKMKTTLKTNEDENFTQNEWRWKLHSERVKMKTILKTCEWRDQESSKTEYSVINEATDVISEANDELEQEKL